MKRNIIIALTFCMSLASMAQTQVTEFNPGIAANGVNYVLPKTLLRMDASAIKVEYMPGEFAKYAERYLHLKGVASEPSTTWKMTTLAVRQEGVPDTAKIFTVKLKDKTVAPMVQLTPSGILVAVTEEILSATSTSKMAELTAQEILDIRESKNAIKRGQVEAMPQDGASLKIVLDELNRQEEALTQLFTGYADTTFTAKTFTVMPAGDISEQVLFRFSTKLGFVDADDLAGDPYYLSVKDRHTVVLPDAKEAAKRKIEGLVYNMPSMANVTISTMQGKVYEQELPFAQFGTIDTLSPTLFNKGATTKLTLYPATGGLMHLEQ